jgi:uncharacterized membrane protein
MKGFATKHPRLAYLPISVIGTILVVVTLASFYVAMNGAHPECATSPDEVGSCDFIGASLTTALWLTVPGIYLWFIALATGLAVIWVRYGSRRKVVDGLVLAFVLMLILYFAPWVFLD